VVLLGDGFRVTPSDSFVIDMEKILSPGSIELR
jgi:hypothetical protein